MAPQITGEISMAYLTKKQERERFIDEFLRRLREAPPGTRVYMRVGDVFKDADVVSIDELRAAREAALVRDDDDVRVKTRAGEVRKITGSTVLTI
jgi:hypothetical protein